MRILLALIFLLTVVVAKDNFIYDDNTPDCNERLTSVEARLDKVEADLQNLSSLPELTEANRLEIAKNGKKIYDITVMNKSNGRKISDIASSLHSIKNILSDSTKLMAKEPKEIVVAPPTPAVQEMDMSEYVKKEGLARIGVQVDNLMDRVAVLEKKGMEKEKMGTVPKILEGTGLPSILGEARTALYDYFEYYVIATVVLFFMMFILIFSLVGKTRRLHLAVEELANRN